jgi:hypothetical protein
VDYALNLNTLVTMVGAGFGIGFASSAQADAIRQEGVLVKTLSGCSSALTTFLIRRVGQDALATARFIARARLFSTETGETF